MRLRLRCFELAELLRRDADSDLPGVRPEASKFEFTIDAVDTALYIADVDACRRRSAGHAPGTGGRGSGGRHGAGNTVRGLLRQ